MATIVSAVVTGASGFIGAHLCDALLHQGQRVLGIDALTPSYDRRQKTANLARLLNQPGFTWLETDVMQLDWGQLGETADVIYHLAGQAGVRTAWGEQFDTYVHDNVLATHHLLEGLHRCQPSPRVIFASSSSIYGDAETLPTPECTTPSPASPYGITKYAAERLGFVHHQAFGIPFTSLRFFTVYGPGQRPDMAFHRFMLALRERRPIDIYGDGQQTRDFTYVNDVVSACLAAAESTSAVGEIINIGGGNPVSLNDTLAMIETVSGQTFIRAHYPPQPGDVCHTSADIAKARRILAYQPQSSLVAGLDAMWCWFGTVPST